MDESRGPPQRRGAARETALRLTARRQFAGVRKAQATARQGRRDRNGRSKPAVDVATLGWKPAAPKGPGRDSAAGSVRSMTARFPSGKSPGVSKNRQGTAAGQTGTGSVLSPAGRKAPALARQNY
ncbi:hypothetical protein ACFLI8_004466 [Salmonella enterica]|nr:hypothetical protein [Salmonella enterica]EJV9650439.1 hypothetical protein [Salmonella enterica]EJX5850652.1 hypothetical protein [Salmonella enterica]ELI6394291.1 hypothetical protein [Salmonella enterica]EMB7956454.1 hypothetical protein [Salmonella enterica]